ncbi:MAG: UMP kinase [Bacilli bacterium]|nr:UMP kinase [Bacilli bacterium]
MEFKRVLVKLSGEALKSKTENQILDADLLCSIAKSIKGLKDQGLEICIVVGAGNIWRGRMAQSMGIESATADYMGMLGTIINSMAIGSALEGEGIDCRVMSSIEIKQIAEPYIRKRAIRHFEKGRVVIFAGGTGNPYFTTDTTAALRAKEVKCDAILMAKNGVDGVYTADPRVDKDAKFLSEITYKDVLRKDLKVMDSTAVSLLQDSDVVIKVFNMADPSNFIKAANNEKIGTTIRKE